MSSWTDLVTTALLGTGRRPLPEVLPESWAPAVAAPGADPAVQLLDLAARHRAVRAAGSPLITAPAASSAPPVSGAPTPDRTPTPPRAAAVLAGLLVRPSAELINHWLACADAAGCGIPAVHWTRLARLSAHSTTFDRHLLGRVLGPRGRWFLAQNPDWRRLAADCAPNTGRPPDQEAAEEARSSTADAESVRGRPESIFGHPDPWPGDLIAAAYAVLGTGSLGRRGREYARRVGARLPPERYDTIAPAATYYLEAPEATPGLRRQVRANFQTLEAAAFTRVEIGAAFATPPGPPPSRIEIPHV
jgi:hypothetical protein